MVKKVIIAGAGGIGRACALMLLQKYKKEILITLADVDANQLTAARQWISGGLDHDLGKLILQDLSEVDTDTWTPEMDLLLDCTPGRFAVHMAKVSLRSGAHYANLTEWIQATEEILDLAKNASSGFALQTGLAPGFINLYARRLIRHFEKTHPDAPPSEVKMRVGALSRYASSPAFYAFTWSPVGVSAEYLNDSEVLRDSRCVRVPALSQREQLLIDGEWYEADLTSGGAADLPEYFEHKIQTLDYKSLRYPGHFDWAKKIVEETPGVSPAVLTGRFMTEVPFHDEDRILLYVSVAGSGEDKRKYEMVRHREILPLHKNQIRLSAIQRTTAASLAQTAELLLKGKISGPLLQSQYPLDEFLNGSFIRDHYGDVTHDF